MFENKTRPYNWVKLIDYSHTTADEYYDIDLSSNTDYFYFYKIYVENVIAADSSTAAYLIMDEIEITAYDKSGNLWSEPYLTSNGVLGKGRFAVWSDVEQTQTHIWGYNGDFYYIFDGIKGHYRHYWFHSVQYPTKYINGNIIFSLPKPLRITNLRIYGHHDGANEKYHRSPGLGAIYGDTNNM